jgi:hypothetical protein
MRINLLRASVLLITLATLLLAAPPAAAQEEMTLKDTTPKRRLRSPATARGFIGGESHDSYVIRARKGQTLTVHISWRRAGGNRAEFEVSESPDFFDSEPAAFGAAPEGGRRWAGRVPRSGDYYIYVIAHPTARYTLSVRVE